MINIPAQIRLKWFFPLLLMIASIGASACGPAAPASPTFEADIRPLLVARCIRCHDNPRHSDPQVGDGKVPLSTFNFLTLSALMADKPSFAFLKLAPTYLRGAGVSRRMPPPPAEKLEDWEIEMVAQWVANPR